MELKPCPFCGSIPKITTYFAHHEDQREPYELVEKRVKFYCDGCFLTKDVAAQSYAMIGLDEKTYWNIGKTLARNIISECWNRRATDGRDNA